MPNPVWPGSDIRRWCNVQSMGAAADPSRIVLRVKKPDGTVAVFDSDAGAVQRESKGRWYADVPFDQAGVWHFRWETSAPNGAIEDSLTVRASKVLA